MVATARRERSPEKLAEIARQLDWADINSLIEACDQDETFWDNGFLQNAERNAKASEIRRLLRQTKDGEGFPEFASIEIPDEDGKIVRVYKQETLFNLDDYKQTATYWHKNVRYAMKMRDGYRRRCKEKFDVFPELPFGD